MLGREDVPWSASPRLLFCFWQLLLKQMSPCLVCRSMPSASCLLHCSLGLQAASTAPFQLHRGAVVAWWVFIIKGHRKKTFPHYNAFSSFIYHWSLQLRVLWKRLLSLSHVWDWMGVFSSSYSKTQWYFKQIVLNCHITGMYQIGTWIALSPSHQFPLCSSTGARSSLPSPPVLCWTRGL